MSKIGYEECELLSSMKNKGIGMEVKSELYEKILFFTVIYGSELGYAGYKEAECDYV